MDFERSDDQVALQEGVRSFLEGRFPIDVVTGLDVAGGFDAGRWRELAELGVFSLRLPESDGGVGMGWADAVLVFEELGRALVPGPLVWTHLAAGIVEGAATGEAVVTGIERDDPSGLVEHPDAVDVLLVLDHEGAWRVDRAELDLVPVGELLDPLTPAARLRGALPQGTQVLDAHGADVLRTGGAMLTAALLVGISEATTELAVAYSRERQQFGRPIGGFQALKHLLADAFTRTAVARSAVEAAGVTLDDPSVGSVARAVGAAKVTAIEAATENTKASVQVHGGMGYTWEVPVHFQLKRAYALAPSFGGLDDHCEVVAGELVVARPSAG